MCDAQRHTSRVRLRQDPVECTIEKLPNELLVAILSYLSIKEAAQTCLVSRRWRYLWQYTSGCLEFYDRDERTLVPEVAHSFIKLVNQVLESHRGPTLEQFRVGFNFYPGCSTTEIDSWIEFAFQKVVKSFELDLAASQEPCGNLGTYIFPDIGKLLSGDIGKLKFSRVCSNLKSLRLVNVHVKEDILHFFLSNCPCLEHVCVSCSDFIKNLKVTGLPNLKSMEVSSCDYIEGLEIDASNLVSFTYTGPDIPVPFQNVPQLSELTIGDQYCDSFIFNADKHISYSSQLRKLKLVVPPYSMRQSWITLSYPDNFPRLNNLRELELDLMLVARESLLFFTFFTRASPLLSKFIARISYTGVLPKENINGAHISENIAQESTCFVHKCLKVVKIIGFTGCRSDYRLASHLLEIGRGSLKKMILQPTNEDHHPKVVKRVEALIEKRSKQLEAKLPPGAKLLIDFKCIALSSTEAAYLLDYNDGRRRRIRDGQHPTSRAWLPPHPLECKIDKVPNELLVAILSYLSIKEAAQTCLVSRRWRYLWQYTSGSLDFYDTDERTLVPEVARSFINLVNQVLKLHRGPTLEQFRVGFNFYPGCSTTEIDSWIAFAFEKEVKSFELDLAASQEPCGNFGTYIFPEIGKLLSGDIGKLKFSRVCSNLKSLRLVNVHVKEDILHLFLSNCPCLEHVCVSRSNFIKNLKVTGPPSLKSMEVSRCFYIKRLEVDASNLVSFTYTGPDIPVPFQNVPQLSELTIGNQYCHSFIFNADKHTSYSSQLRKLKLRVPPYSMRESWITLSYPDNFPRLNNLRELELDLMLVARESLLFFTFFTRASPLLSKFIARISYTGVLPKENINGAHISENSARESTCFVHKCLKVVKIIGFTGCRSDYRLASHLLEIGRGSLKKMILQPMNEDHHPKVVKRVEALIEKRSKQRSQVATRG